MKTNTKHQLRDFHKLASMFNNWINELSVLKSQHTVASYRTSMRLYIQDYLVNEKGLAFKRFDISTAFSKNTMKEWLEWLQNARDNMPQTVNLRLRNLCAFLQYASDNDIGYMEYYLNAKSIKPRKIIPTKVSGMNEAALETLINTPNTRTRIGLRDTVIMGLMFATGARINEVLSLRIRDLKLPKKNGIDGRVTFLGKGNKYRTIALLEASVKQLILYIKVFHGTQPNLDDLVFYSNTKGRKSKITQRAIDFRLKKYAEMAREKCDEVPKSLHSHQFRHSRATLWIKEGHNLAAVSRLLGHESVITTMHYLDITPQMMSEAMQKALDVADVEQEWKDEEDMMAYFNF